MVNLDLDEAIALLDRAPRMLDAWLRGLPAAWLEANEGPGTFSPYDVVGHLVFGEQTDWIPRIEQMLSSRASEPFAPFDRFGFAKQPGAPIGELLDEFARLRAANLATLRALRLTPAEFARAGRHPEFGPVTFGQHLATWVAHDASHFAQIARVMARRYAADVGPWRAYLRVLRD
jgi:DinB superfamily